MILFDILLWIAIAVVSVFVLCVVVYFAAIALYTVFKVLLGVLYFAPAVAVIIFTYITLQNVWFATLAGFVAQGIFSLLIYHLSNLSRIGQRVKTTSHPQVYVDYLPNDSTVLRDISHHLTGKRYDTGDYLPNDSTVLRDISHHLTGKRYDTGDYLPNDSTVLRDIRDALAASANRQNGTGNSSKQGKLTQAQIDQVMNSPQMRRSMERIESSLSKMKK